MTTARYSTGEEPRVGDVVHRVLDGTMAAGEVHVVAGCRVSSGAWVTVMGRPYEYEAYRFALIARAGEPVTYQPGDVVEAFKDFTDSTGRKRLTKGNRYIVSRRSKQVWIERCDAGYDCCWESGDDFRLVHRPVATASMKLVSDDGKGTSAVLETGKPPSVEVAAQPNTASALNTSTLDARADPPARCAYEAAADAVRDQVARLNDAVFEAQAVGVSCEFDTLERGGVGLARSTIVTVTCRREV